MSYFKSIAGWLENILEGGLCLSALPQAHVSSENPTSSSHWGRRLRPGLCPQGAFADEENHLIKIPEFRAKCDLSGGLNRKLYIFRKRPMRHAKVRFLITLLNPVQLPLQNHRDSIVNGVIFSCSYKRNMHPRESSAAILLAHQGKAEK